MTGRIIVHSLDHARAAVAAAAALGVPVALVSAPGAGSYAGPRWFMALVAAAADRHPGTAVTAIVDCADEAGTALAALRAGCRSVIFTGPPETGARLAEIAAPLGAAVEGWETGEGPAAALDLLGARDAGTACRAYLAPSGT